jgi:hypothetical protein
MIIAPKSISFAKLQQRQRRADVARQRARALPRHGRLLLQVAAVEQFHRVERALLVDAVVVHRDHAWMGQVRQRVELALEQLRAAPALLRVFQRVQPLESELAPGREVGDLVHRRHAAATDGAFDAEPPPDEPGLGRAFCMQGRTVLARIHAMSIRNRQFRCQGSS